MVKNHLKSIASPRTWNVLRKEYKFIARSNPGSHTMKLSIPLSILVRDMLNKADTLKQVKYILQEKHVLVNGKMRKDHRFAVGRFDIITFVDTKDSYQILLDKKGKIFAKEVKDSVKPNKIKSKTIINGGKIQLNFMDGTNFIAEKGNFKVGDSVVIKDGKIEHHLPFEKGAIVFIAGGKYIGHSGKLEDVKDNKIIFKTENGESIETLKRYAIVIGKDKSVVEIK